MPTVPGMHSLLLVPAQQQGRPTSINSGPAQLCGWPAPEKNSACVPLSRQPPAEHNLSCQPWMPAELSVPQGLPDCKRFPSSISLRDRDNSIVRSPLPTLSGSAIDAASLTIAASCWLRCGYLPEQLSRLEPSWSSLSMQVPLCPQLAVLCCPTHTLPPPSWRLGQHPCCPMHVSSLLGAPNCPAHSAERLAADQILHPDRRPRVVRSSRCPSLQGRRRLLRLRHLRCASCICLHSQGLQCAPLPLS